MITFPSLVSSSGNAFANIITNTNGSLLSATINATSGNYGFRVDGEGLDLTTIANSTGGYTRYFNSDIVNLITISNSSPSYKVSSVAVTANGTNYNSTKVLRVDIQDGGTGYNSVTNNLIVFTGGGGSGANATFVNNNIGKITSITMVANGSGYSSAVTAAPATAAAGIGANLSVVLANSLSFTSTTGGYGAVARFTNNALGEIVSVSVVNSGFSYTSAPTATVQDPTGLNATFTVTVDGGANNYTTGDIIVATNGDINATATITTNAQNYISSLTLTNSGKGHSYNTVNVLTTNTTGGSVRYFNGNLVREITVTSSGYPGFGSNSDILTISNGSINTIANIETTINGQLNAVSITSSGKGFANHSSLLIKVTNSVSGNTRYLNTNVVSSYTINDGGLS